MSQDWLKHRHWFKFIEVNLHVFLKFRCRRCGEEQLIHRRMFYHEMLHP